MLLEVHKFAIQAQGFEFAMRGDQQRAARSLIASARLDAYKAVLDQVNPPDGVAPADFVQQLHQRDRIHVQAVHRNRNALLEADFHLLFAVRRLLRRVRELPRAR